MVCCRGGGGASGEWPMRAFLVVAAFATGCGAAPASVIPKTAVLVHGFHLEAPDWDDVVWGGGRGRIAHGARVAATQRAAFLIVGSGASAAGGETEAEAALRVLRERGDDAGRARARRVPPRPASDRVRRDVFFFSRAQATRSGS